MSGKLKICISTFAFALLFALTLTSCENDLLYVKSGGMPEVKGKFDNIVEYSFVPDGDGCESVIPYTTVWAQNGAIIYDGKIYFTVDYSRKAGIVMDMPCCFNEETGNVTTLCPDPLCEHNSPECPFYGFSTAYTFFIENGWLYYKHAGYAEGDSAGDCIARYDLKSGKYEKIRDVTSNVMNWSAAAVGDNFYFIDMSFDEETQSWSETFCVQNMKTGDVEPYGEKIAPVVGYDGRVLCCEYDTETPGVYSFAPDMSDKKYIGSFGNSFVRCGDHLIAKKDGALYTYGLDGSDEKPIGAQGLSYFFVTDEYVYYSVKEETVTVKIPGGGGIYSENSADHPQTVSYDACAVYRMKHDGTEVTEIWRPDTENEAHLMLMQNFVVKGRYIYGGFSWYDYDAEHDVWISDNEHGGVCVRIDTETGEEYFLDMGK